jgi:hypothetical protein
MHPAWVEVALDKTGLTVQTASPCFLLAPHVGRYWNFFLVAAGECSLSEITLVVAPSSDCPE